MSNIKIYENDGGQLSFLSPSASRPEYEGEKAPRPKPTSKQILRARQAKIEVYWQAFEQFVRAVGKLAGFYKVYSLEDSESAQATVNKIVTKACEQQGRLITPKELLRSKCSQVVWQLIELYQAAQAAKIPGDYPFLYAKDLTQQLMKKLLVSQRFYSKYTRELQLVEVFCFCSAEQRSWLYGSFFRKAKEEHVAIGVEDTAKIFRLHIS